MGPAVPLPAADAHASHSRLEIMRMRGCYLRPMNWWSSATAACGVCSCPVANLALERTGLRQHLFFADDVRTALESGLSERRPSNVIRTSFG
jgi:hypothetical protein